MSTVALTPSGKLYEIDTRLRPNGQSGLLVSSIKAFKTYQRNEAWTWEAQALTRARAVAGDPALVEDFEDIRMNSLCRKRDQDELCRDLREMRERIRAAHGDGTKPGTEIKHGPGGMVDIGFLAQLGVLETAYQDPEVARHCSVSSQLQRLHASGWLDQRAFQILERQLAMLRKLRFSRELELDKPDAAVMVDKESGVTIARQFEARTGTP